MVGARHAGRDHLRQDTPRTRTSGLASTATTLMNQSGEGRAWEPGATHHRFERRMS